MTRFIFYLLAFTIIVTSCASPEPVVAKTLWTQPISFNANDYDCPKHCLQISDDKLFFISKGEFFGFDLASGKKVLRFGSSVSRFDIKNGLALIEETQDTETIITLISTISLKTNWQYRFQPGDYFRPTSAFFADSLVLIQEVSSLRLRAFDVVSGELVWEQPEQEGYYLSSVTTKENIIYGIGGIHTTTKTLIYRRDIYTGELIGDIELCYIDCPLPNPIVFYEHGVFEYSYEISTYNSSFLGVDRHNTSTDEWFGCSIGNEPIYEPGIDDFQLKYRIEKVYGNDQKLLMQVSRTEEAIKKYGLKKVIYIMPPCNEKTKDTIYSSREFLFGIKQIIPWTKFVPISDSFFVTQLLGSNGPVFLTLSNTNEIVESELAGLPILSQGKITLENVNGLTSAVNLLELKGRYLISATKQVFQVNDINSKEILLSVDIAPGSTIQYFSLDNYIVVHTNGGVSVIRNPLTLDLN